MEGRREGGKGGMEMRGTGKENDQNSNTYFSWFSGQTISCPLFRNPQQYTTAVHHSSTPQQYTTAVHHSSTPQQYTTAVHHSSTPQQYTTAVHHSSTPQQYTTSVRSTHSTASSGPPPPSLSAPNQHTCVYTCRQYHNEANVPTTDTA